MKFTLRVFPNEGDHRYRTFFEMHQNILLSKKGIVMVKRLQWKL